MSLGPVMLDLEGTELLPEERELLRNPAVGGVILFSRNYESPQQLSQLVSDIHLLHTSRLLVAVDHEGGRVQRFRHEFTHLPPVSRLGEIYDTNSKQARQMAEITGWLMAAELRSVGIDFSFAPVLDLKRAKSSVIGDRAFHADPETVTNLAHSYISGMQRGGMEAVGKHFPGHGSVKGDSHLELLRDSRSFAEIEESDLIPFTRLISSGLAALMPAHVVYEKVDQNPAGFSRIWLQEILRGRFGFQGAIISDDLNMEGAAAAGDYGDRAELALEAGCDLILICNNRPGAEQILDRLSDFANPIAHSRLIRLHGRKPVTRNRLLNHPDWQRAADMIADYDVEPMLDMDD